MRNKSDVPIPPACQECGSDSVLTPGHELYPGKAHLAGLMFWACMPCEAWVGCHPKSTIPLGYPVGYKTRRARQQAHATFDPLWKRVPVHRRKVERMRAYAWLARSLEISADECHIGMMDIERCERVVALCRPKLIELEFGS